MFNSIYLNSSYDEDLQEHNQANAYVTLGDGTTVTYPGYGLFNAALYYRIRHLQVQANLNNVFNRTYWVGGYDKLRSFPGAPRNINLTVTYGF